MEKFKKPAKSLFVALLYSIVVMVVGFAIFASCMIASRNDLYAPLKIATVILIIATAVLSTIRPVDEDEEEEVPEG